MDVESRKKVDVNLQSPPTPLKDDNCQEVTPGCKLCILSYPTKKEILESTYIFDAYLEPRDLIKIRIEKMSALGAFFLSWVARHVEITSRVYFLTILIFRRWRRWQKIHI